MFHFPAAKEVFGVGDCVGKLFLTVERSSEMTDAAESALCDGRCELK